MIKSFFNIPSFAWTAIALLIAITFAFIWPRKAVTATTGLRYFIIRWGHALTWLLLMVSFLLRGIGPELNGGASFLALAGGVVYVCFIAIILLVK